MARIPTSQVEERRRRLVELLPQYDWSIAKAGVAAGYSRKYAETTLQRTVKGNASLCKAILQRKAEIQATEGDEIEKLAKFWRNTRNNEDAPLRDRLKASELEGKYLGIFSAKCVLEVGERQRQLSQTEQEEARRLALLRFDTSNGDSAPNRTVKRIQGEIINVQTEPKADPKQGQGDAHKTCQGNDLAETAPPMTPQAGSPVETIIPSEIPPVFGLSDPSCPESKGGMV